MTNKKNMKWTVIVSDPQKVIDRSVIGLGSLFDITINNSTLAHGYCNEIRTQKNENGIVYAFGLKPVSKKKKSKERTKQ